MPAKDHIGERITERLDALYGDAEVGSALDRNLEKIQFLSLPVDDGWRDAEESGEARRLPRRSGSKAGG